MKNIWIKNQNLRILRFYVVKNIWIKNQNLRILRFYVVKNIWIKNQNLRILRFIVLRFLFDTRPGMFFSKPSQTWPAFGRAAALQECPCGAFWARCAHLLRKWASVKARPLHAGALPLHPTGDRDGPRTPAIVLKD
ncbi:MAG: hypothetical protein HQL90_14215 [Magnetococcales bacterium]|nr:hypothetical protein [Magnetococcales bacterium]